MKELETKRTCPFDDIFLDGSIDLSFVRYDIEEFKADFKEILEKCKQQDEDRQQNEDRERE